MKKQDGRRNEHQHCRCDEQPSTSETDKSPRDWYKEMYQQIHKSPETNKEVIRVKLPSRRSILSEYIHQRREATNNPYQPTYTFPKEFDGNLELMEGYIRKAAAQSDDDDEPASSSIVQPKKSEENHYASPRISASSDEQKSLYKRILRGGEIPSGGLQKFLVNQRDKPNPDGPTVKSSPPNKPIHRAVALHNFQAQSNRELPFKKGETFLVQRRINNDWYEGEHQGVTGIFPANHVELLPVETAEDESQGEAIVKFDFIPQKTFELQLRKGDKVTLLRRLNNNWYEGRVKNLEGIFPATYVETLKEPKERLDEKKRQSPPMLMRKCRVLFNYTPQNADELQIHVGDIITIVEMCDDGWYCGLMEKSKYTKKMEFGTFPGNYVELLPEDS